MRPVLIDSSVWSLYLRRRTPHPVHLREVERLLSASAVAMIGIVRQEVLQGVREVEQYHKLRAFFRRFEDVPATTDDHERAAAFHNACRRAGVQGSAADFLVAAIASRLGTPIYTTDRDFTHFAKLLPVRLYQPK